MITSYITARRYVLMLAMILFSALTALADNVVKVESISVKAGGTATVPIVLENSDNVSSLQMDFTLPQGISYVDGGVVLNTQRVDESLFDVMFTNVTSKYTDEQKTQFAAESVWRLLVLSKDGSAIKGNSGEIASVTIKVAEKFLSHSELNVVGIIGSYEAKKISFADCLDIQIISLNIANEDAYTRLNGIVSEVQSALDAAKTTINNECKDVAANYTSTIAEIQKSIDALKADLEAKYKNVELTAESTIDTSAIIAAIEKLKTDAAAAQKTYEEQKAEEEAEAAKKQANEAAYTRLSAQIAEVQKVLDTAKTTINNDYKDVSSQLSEQISLIQNSIDNLKADVKKKYDNVELNAESTIDTSAITSSITKLLSDAKAAQELYEAGEAAKLANEVAYAKLKQQLSNVQSALDAAQTSINNDCKEVAANYTATIADIQKSIDALKADLEAKYKNVELTAESTIDTAAITAAIEKLKTDAVAAQKAYEKQQAEEAKKQANEAAYTRLSAQITEVQKALDAAKNTINNECKDVASQFTEQISLIQNSIDDMKADVKKKYDNVELNAESTIDTSAITASITKLLSDAKAAQELYEAGEATKLANEVAYAKLSQQLSNVQSALDAAKTTINSDCKDVAAQFAKTIADIQKSIDALKADLEAKYKNVELTAESTIDTSNITAAIEKLKSDAAAAQKAYEESVGIDSVYGDGAKAKAIYSITGQKVEEPKPGMLYIFVYENGKTVKKVMK